MADQDRIKYLLDEHVSSAVAEALRRRGIDVQTSHEAGTQGLSDREVLAFARLTHRVVVTHDQDFLRLHRTREEHHGIAFSQQSARSLRELIDILVLMFEALSPCDMRNRVEYL